MEDSVLQPECFKRHAIIENHIEEGKGWRTVIVSIAITLIIQVGIFLQMWGGLNKMVEINTARLACLEKTVYNIK